MIKLLVAAGDSVRAEEIERLDLQAADCTSVLARPAGSGRPQFSGAIRMVGCATGGLPDFSAIHDLLQQERPDACVILGDCAFARLFAVAADLRSVSIVTFVDSASRLKNMPYRDKTRPDIFLLTDLDLLPKALNDDRYGATLIALPGDSSEFRSAFESIVRRWADNKLDSGQPNLSVIVPAFREADNLYLVCTRLLDALAPAEFSWEILLVDDASPDETYRVALKQMMRSPRIRALTKSAPRGMGNAVRHGIRMARGSHLAITMGDGSDEVERIPDMYRTLASGGYSLAIGSRYRRPENYANIPGLYRFWSRGFRITSRLLTGVSLSDYTNAFRVFDRAIFSHYGPESGGFEISPEITFKAWLATRKVTEVDVRHLKRASGQSKFSFLKAGPGYGKILIKAVVARITGKWFTLDW